MALKEAAIDPTPLLAGAGVIGVAIGFGAQTFVGDIVAGFFILFEDLILVGDLVEIGGVKGKVEEIGVRITKIRDDSGVLHSIPNGQVRKVANHSREHVNAVVDVHVPYEEDARRVRGLLERLTEQVLEEEGIRRGPVEVKVQELSEAAMLLRVIARVPPGMDEDASDVLRARVVEGLRAARVAAPKRRRVVILDSPLHVGARPAARLQEEDEAPEPFKPAVGSD
jgi:small conductance mechanosensitive channel